MLPLQIFTNTRVGERSEKFLTGRGSAWLERLVRDQEVDSSNLSAPTIKSVEREETGSSVLLGPGSGGWIPFHGGNDRALRGCDRMG